MDAVVNEALLALSSEVAAIFRLMMLLFPLLISQLLPPRITPLLLAVERVADGHGKETASSVVLRFIRLPSSLLLFPCCCSLPDEL